MADHHGSRCRLFTGTGDEPIFELAFNASPRREPKRRRKRVGFRKAARMDDRDKERRRRCVENRPRHACRSSPAGNRSRSSFHLLLNRNRMLALDNFELHPRGWRAVGFLYDHLRRLRLYGTREQNRKNQQNAHPPLLDNVYILMNPMRNAIFAIFVLSFATRSAFAMASTDVIEGPMEAHTAALYGFPDNALTLINDWHRVYAWHPWFSELPNATYYFAFNAPTMSHVNELLGYFGELKAKELVVDLSPAER